MKVRMALLVSFVAAATGCMVGPKYSRPAAPAPAAYREPPPEGWKESQPDDGKIRGKWWEMFDDAGLNALEEQVSISNQNVLAAEAQYRAARDAVRIARANLFPAINTTPSITNTGSGHTTTATGGSAGGARTSTTYSLPFELSYQADVWGSIRRSVHTAADVAQASNAQLENAKLTYQPRSPKIISCCASRARIRNCSKKPSRHIRTLSI